MKRFLAGIVCFLFFVPAPSVFSDPIEGTWTSTSLGTSTFDGEGKVTSPVGGQFGVGDESNAQSTGKYWQISGLVRTENTVGDLTDHGDGIGSRLDSNRRSGGVITLRGDLMWGQAAGLAYTGTADSAYSGTSYFRQQGENWVFDHAYGAVTVSGTLETGHPFTLTAEVYIYNMYEDTRNNVKILEYQMNDCTLIIETGAAANSPPDAPVLSYPSDGSAGISLAPTLATAGFSDSDTGDTHLQTDWDISTSTGFTETVLYRQSGVHLTSLPVPDLALEPDTTYYWRARFYDSASNVSDWSPVFSFTTEPDFDDSNANGIPDDLENDSADLDSDGVADIRQETIKSLNTVVGEGQMGVSIKNSPTATAITRVDAIDPDTISEYLRPGDMTLGLFSFRVNVASAGDMADVVVHFSQPAPINARWYFYDAVNRWTDYSDHAVFSADRRSVTLSLQDGGTGDADGIANRVIVDPSGFGVGSWIKGKVTDTLTGQAVSNCTLTISDSGLSVAALADGSFLSMILAGTYDISVSAPGYQSQTLAGISIPEAVIVTQNIVLSGNAGISSLTVSGQPDTGSPVSFSVTGISDDPLYYRFSVHPYYGTSDYDGSHWTLMTDTEYAAQNSCTYTFDREDRSIVVVWLTPVAENVDSSGIPIIGWSVDTRADKCRTNFSGMSISGTRRVNMPVTFSVSAGNPCTSSLYYRFSMHPDYGTGGYDGKHWQQMTDTEWVTENSIDYLFTEAGKYIVVVWVSDKGQSDDQAGIPIIGWSIDIE